MISFRLLSSYAWSSTLPSRVACHDLLSSARRGPAHVDHIFSKSPASELDMNVHFGMFIRALRSWIIQRPITSFLILGYATTAALAFVPKALTEPGLPSGRSDAAWISRECRRFGGASLHRDSPRQRESWRT